MEIQFQRPTDRKSYNLSNSVIFNDLERPLTQISRACHYLTLHISETIQDTIHGYYRPLIESDMWPIELCHRHGP